MPPESNNQAPASETVVQAAVRVFGEQYQVVATNRARLIADGDAEALHDLRVALRRFRAALRLFPHNGSQTAPLDQRLDALTTQLGPLRDTDVWLKFLASPGVNGPFTEIIRAQQDKRRREALRMREALAGADCARTLEGMANHADTRAPSSAAFRVLASGCLDSELGRLFRRVARVTESSPADEAHKLRKRARRLRYWAEFSAPAFPAFMAELATRLHALAAALGRVHDMDMFMARADETRSQYNRQLCELISGKRREYWQEYEGAMAAVRHAPELNRLLNETR